MHSRGHFPRALVWVIPAALAGCSFFDFFGYQDDAPLHVIDRPSGYPSVRFGAEIAPSSIRGGMTIDLVGVSAGEGYPTVFYKLAEDGDLVDAEDPWDEYDKSALECEADGSGSSLAGLPVWGDDLRTGCVAIGEPGNIRQVVIYCPEDFHSERITAAAITAQDPVPDENLVRRFGHQLAAIRPVEGAAWLLAAASEYFVVVCSAVDRCTDRLVPEYAGLSFPGKIVELAAGRLSGGRIYVAATTADDSAVAVVNRMHLFVQDAPLSPGFSQVACVNRSAEPGFAGRMTTGDLDRDGTDELILSAGRTAGRLPVVYVYDPALLAAAAPECNSDAPEPLASIVPGEGPLDVACGDACDFGIALAVGDIATDDNGPEVIVGAPGAAVDGVTEAGAAWIYRGAALIEGGQAPVAGRVAHSSPVSAANFGGGLAVAPMAGRNELLVGMTGKGKLAIVYCTGVGEDLAAGADVTSGSDGSVISTRCRPK
jgi:hypothetical protein